MVVLADFDEVVVVVVFGDQNGMNQSLMSRMGMVLEEVVWVGLVVVVMVVECLVSCLFRVGVSKWSRLDL